MRTTILLGMGVCLALGLAGCSSPDATATTDPPSEAASSAASGPVELTFQSWVPNIDKAVDQFNAAHPGIHVTLETITAGPDGGYAKMFSAVKAGNAADVAQVGYDWLPDFVRNDAAEDISSYFKDSASLFADWQVAAMTFADKVYGVPQASSPLGLYYRSDVFAEAGASVPTTWDEFYDAAKKIHASNSERYIAAFAFNQTPWLLGLSEQAGAVWFAANTDSWTVNIDGPETMKVAQFWQKLIDEDLVKIEADMSSEWYADIQSGNIATWICGSWGDAIIRGNAPDTAGKWAVAYMPQWQAGQKATGTWAGGSANVVLKGTKHPAEAAQFAIWLNSNPESVSTLVSIGAGWPSIKDISSIASLQSDPTVFDFYDGQDIWDVFAESDSNVASRWKWPPLVPSLYSAITDNMKSAIDSKRPLGTAFTQSQTAMVDALKAAGISVS
ncbi:MAG: extracellular solute-binding protein [Propionibacteriaceae bacterium]|jgi:multiple sugar transport system substrate-binding protein|nr:extracellular solute-binding protein [Propionibacteriaceae bacterium]